VRFFCFSNDENFVNLMPVCQNQTFLAAFPTFVAPNSDFFVTK